MRHLYALRMLDAMQYLERFSNALIGVIFDIGLCLPHSMVHPARAV